MLLSGKPCVERISFEWGEKIKDVTCDAVGREEIREPVVEDLCVRPIKRMGMNDRGAVGNGKESLTRSEWFDHRFLLRMLVN